MSSRNLGQTHIEGRRITREKDFRVELKHTNRISDHEGNGGNDHNEGEEE